MATFIIRSGLSLPADAVFEAWTSADLTRMLAVRGLQTHPIDRHFLLMGIVGQTYRKRQDPQMRALCIETAKQHIQEFATIASALRDDLGGWLPRVSTFTNFATVLAEDGKFAEAIAVCKEAMRYGLHDGTKGGFRGRITRIENAAAGSSGRAE
jgi:hypothetical protein